jgi:hypothetical protein
MERLISGLLKHRFHTLAGAVLLLTILQYLSGFWGVDLSDFWEHAAVVRELAANPLSPGHPQLLIDAPHAFYSPYALAAAVISRTLSLSPITTLSLLGIVNLVLLLWGIRLLLSSLLPGSGATVPFYALFFILLLWGDGAWLYSGFLHASVVPHVLPYPSTFAAALSFLVLHAYDRLQDRFQLSLYSFVLLGSSIIILTHPPTAAFVAAGMIALTVAANSLNLRSAVLLASIAATSLILALLWPYYPLWSLLAESVVFDPSNRVMYSQPIARMGPALLGIPIVGYRLLKEPRDALGLTFLALIILYGFGAVTREWTYGRVISLAVVILQIAVAAAVASGELRLQVRRRGSLLRMGYCGAVLLLVGLFSYEPHLRSTITLRDTARHGSLEPYEPLSDLTAPRDVVLADLKSSWLVPAFGGKVVAAKHALAFVPDHPRRTADVRRFFGNETARDEQLAIIDNYGVGFLLINRDEVPGWKQMRMAFAPLGHTVLDEGPLILIELH